MCKICGTAVQVIPLDVFDIFPLFLQVVPVVHLHVCVIIFIIYVFCCWGRHFTGVVLTPYTTVI